MKKIKYNKFGVYWNDSGELGLVPLLMGGAVSSLAIRARTTALAIS